MSATQPVSMYAMRVPPGDIMVPALPQFAAAMGLRVTMAAIDPSEEVVVDAADRKPRATLKIITIPSDMLDEDDPELDEDEEDDEDDLEANGGPSDKKLSRKIREAMEEDSEEDDEDMDEDDEEDEAEAQKVLAKLMKASKGKAVAGGDEDEDSEEDDDDDMLGGELDECVVCTLDPEKQYQQPLDFTIAGGERIFFKVSGTHTIHLTGNYVMPLDEPEDEDEEDDYDEDEELDGLDDLLNGDDESDELDDLEDPRVMELDSEEEAKVAKKAEKVLKGKNKRTAPDSDNEETALDDVMAKIFNKGEPAAAAAAAPIADAATSEEKPKKMSKAEKKAAKKLKNNEGEATAAPEAKPEEKKDTAAKVNGTTPESDKKSVKFAKNLEQGPTPSGNKPTEKPAEKKTSSSLGVRDVQGVTVDDRKVGTGPAAKKGSRLEMRYIGKLENGKVFDSNKSGKPFSLKLGAGDVIKGWDIGLAGMSAGGERRLTIPPAMAYGKKAMPGIPANSKLIFDVKCLSVK